VREGRGGFGEAWLLHHCYTACCHWWECVAAQVQLVTGLAPSNVAAGKIGCAAELTPSGLAKTIDGSPVGRLAWTVRKDLTR
jgi:hypothetical protein